MCNPTTKLWRHPNCVIITSLFIAETFSIMQLDNCGFGFRLFGIVFQILAVLHIVIIWEVSYMTHLSGTSKHVNCYHSHQWYEPFIKYWNLPIDDYFSCQVLAKMCQHIIRFLMSSENKETNCVAWWPLLGLACCPRTVLTQQQNIMAIFCLPT